MSIFLTLLCSAVCLFSWDGSASPSRQYVHDLDSARDLNREMARPNEAALSAQVIAGAQRVWSHYTTATQSLDEDITTRARDRMANQAYALFNACQMASPSLAEHYREIRVQFNKPLAGRFTMQGMVGSLDFFSRNIDGSLSTAPVYRFRFTLTLDATQNVVDFDYDADDFKP